MPSFIQNIKDHFIQKGIEKRADNIFKQAKNEAKEYRKLFGCLPFRYCTGINQGVFQEKIVKALRFEGIPTEVKQLVAKRFAKKEDSPALDAAHSSYRTSVRVLSEVLSQVSAIESQLAYAQERKRALEAGKIGSSGNSPEYELLRKKEQLTWFKEELESKKRAIVQTQETIAQAEQTLSAGKSSPLLDESRERIHVYQRQILGLTDKIKVAEGEIAQATNMKPEDVEKLKKQLDLQTIENAIQGHELTLRSLNARIKSQHATMHETCKQVEELIPVAGASSAILLRYLPVQIGEARHDALWREFALPRHTPLTEEIFGSEA